MGLAALQKGEKKGGKMNSMPYEQNGDTGGTLIAKAKQVQFV